MPYLSNITKYKPLVFLIALFLGANLTAQQKTNFFEPSDTLNIKRRRTVIISEAVMGGATLIGLNQLWYADHPRSGFHFYNDNSEWLQMDKVGHAYSSYVIGKVGMNALNWAGVSKRDQLIYGATLGFVFLTTVEVLDGFSKEWGFSIGDMAANAAGTGLLIGQELLWQEQRIQFKFSFSKSPYADLYPDKLGSNTIEQILKDYNGQTYWLSFNIKSFFKESNIPAWLNLAVGYGVNGVPEYENIEGDTYRQFYTSLDLDLTKINTKSPVLKTIFNLVNYLKIPAPTVEFNPKDKVKFHWIHINYLTFFNFYELNKKAYLCQKIIVSLGTPY